MRIAVYMYVHAMDISKPRCCCSSSFYLSLSPLPLAFPLALSFCTRSLSRGEHTTQAGQEDLTHLDLTHQMTMFL